MFKRVTLEQWVYPACFFLGYGRFLPVPYAPGFAHSFFLSFGVLFQLLGLLVLSIVLISNLVRKRRILTVALSIVIYAGGWLASPYLNDWNNHLVMWVNEGRASEDFLNPVLGMQVQEEEPIQNSGTGRVRFRFNNLFMSYDELIYQPDHGLNTNIPEIKYEASFHKIYNQDWWWYKHLD